MATIKHYLEIALLLGEKKKRKIRFLAFWNMTHWGTNHKLAFDDVLTFLPVLKLELQITAGTLTVLWCRPDCVIKMSVCWVWMFQVDQIETALSGRSTFGGGPESLKVWEQNNLRETFTKLRRDCTKVFDKGAFLQTWQLADEVQHRVQCERYLWIMLCFNAKITRNAWSNVLWRKATW